MKKKTKDTSPQRKPTRSVSSKPVFPAVIADLKEREQTGIKTYGQSLHTKNGRDALKDLYQELLDAVVYLKQKLMEGPEDFADYIPAIDPIETPELSTFSLDIEHREGTGIKFYESPFLDLKPGKFIPVAADPTVKMNKKWFEFDYHGWLSPIFCGWRPMKKESILEEAERLVNGDRGANYGHPLDDFGRTAGMISSLLSAKLKEPLLAEDVAKIMVCVKLSREVNKPGRDNRVDAVGYVECLDKVIEERARRGQMR